jgi:hypothetical protein
MNLLGLLVAAVVTVPPGDAVVNHAQPYQYAQPTLRRFERRAEDEARHRNWDAYCLELDRLWTQYRMAGSTPGAWEKYRQAADQAKLRYVYNDPYLAPVLYRADRDDAR